MDSVKSGAAKHMTLDQIKQIAELLSAKQGDLLLVVAGAPRSSINHLAKSARKWELV